MKKFIFPVLILLLIPIFGACSASEEDIDVPELYGTWQTEVVDGASHYSMSYTFNEDKTYRHTITMPQSEFNPSEYTQDSEGTYKIEKDDKLVLLQNDSENNEEETVSTEYTYAFDDGKLVLTDNSGTYTFDPVKD